MLGSSPCCCWPIVAASLPVEQLPAHYAKVLNLLGNVAAPNAVPLLCCTIAVSRAELTELSQLCSGSCRGHMLLCHLLIPRV